VITSIFVHHDVIVYLKKMNRKSKRIFVGNEGSGKSLLVGMECEDNIYRNARWNRITGLSRPIVYNVAFSPKLLKLADSLGVEMHIWRHVAELPKLSECDLYIDELATYFDSRLFADLPLNIRLWLAQAEKLGVEIVGCAQDFGQVDKSFRRLCKEVFEVKKVVGSRRPMKTAPPVKFIWGVCLKWALEPRSFDGEQVDMKAIGWPSIFFIRKKNTELFDTNTRVSLSDPPPLQKVIRHWYDDDGSIGFTRVKYY